MCRIAMVMTLVCAAGAGADVWNTLEFYTAKGNPEDGAVQTEGDTWTFRRDAFDGVLMTGIRGGVTCETDIGMWGYTLGPYFLPCVGPRVSPDEDVDEGREQRVPEYDGLMVIPTPDEDAFLVFTASGPMTVPTLKLRAEIVMPASNGVLVTVATRIGGQVQTWLDHARVSSDDAGFQEWALFRAARPQMQKGDVLWIDVDPDVDYNGDWTNLSLESAGCYGDCTGDGALDLFDFLCFVNQFNAGLGIADCDDNGAMDLFDFLCFVNSFNAGC